MRSSYDESESSKDKKINRKKKASSLKLKKFVWKRSDSKNVNIELGSVIY